MVTVGIPRALAYYSYFPFWNTFFENLGAEVVVSGVTTKEVLDQGVSEASNDLCIPIKIYFGHVAQLRNRVDKIFVPRLVSVNGWDTFCPKFLGLPDMVAYGMEKLPDLISPRIKVGKNPWTMVRLAKLVANSLGYGTGLALKALRKAMQVQRAFNRLLKEGLIPTVAMEILAGNRVETESEADSKTSIAVLGYPYSLYDDYFNANLLKKLASLEVKVCTPEMVPYHILRQKARYLPKNLFWHFSNRVLWAGMYYLERPEVDGIIHVSNFACGPDAMVNKLLELEAKRFSRPFLTVTLDEHTGREGIHTRLEAFVDMVLWRRRRKG